MHFAFEGGVPMIFDRVIRSPRDHFRNLRPPIPIPLMRRNYRQILILSPVLSLYARVQMVMPSLPALLPDSARQLTRNRTPILRTTLMHHLHYNAVLFLRPRTLNQFGIQYLLPSV
jgi:hypothetical protein